MINKFQKGIWILSISIPIWICFALSWWVTQRTWLPSVIAVLVAILLVSLFLLSYRKTRKSLSTIEIHVKKVTQSDRPVILYMISYILPFGSIVFEKYNLWLFLGLAALIYVVIVFSNSMTANPLLFMVGYHFYDIEGENGIGNYLLMTKKVIRNKDEISDVKRVTEYFLMMQEDEYVSE